MNLDLSGLLHNRVLIAGLIAWMTAQAVKVPIAYLRTRRWTWAPLFTVGGIASSLTPWMTRLFRRKASTASSQAQLPEEQPPARHQRHAAARLQYLPALAIHALASVS